jgi:tetratricopeptide (TPR) repeat protein
MNEMYNSIDVGDTRKAIAILEEILRIQPDWEHGGGWFELAGFYMKCLEFEKAAECYAKGLIFPGHDDSLQNFWYSEALAGCGRLDESFERLKKAISGNLEFDGQKSTLPNHSINSILGIVKYWEKCNGKLIERLYISFPNLAYLWKDIEEGQIGLPEPETLDEIKKRYLGAGD